jgi:hypothetical protein
MYAMFNTNDNLVFNARVNKYPRYSPFLTSNFQWKEIPQSRNHRPSGRNSDTAVD